jgi:predicted nucleic acid-binding protein
MKTQLVDASSCGDPDDWPIVAAALLLDLPIWTEDQDFFGSGIAIWTTDRVEIYLQQR